MATVITSECINCGACEPECPNTAIYQGGVEWELNGEKHPAIAQDIFYIVPEKCTECVGFHDHEACAAVCPVDCCVPDPQIPETEDVLMARAKQLHPDQDFPADYPSRFKKGNGHAAEAAATAAAAPAPVTPATAAPTPTVKPAPAPKAAAPAVPAAAARVERAVSAPKPAAAAAAAPREPRALKTFPGELDVSFEDARAMLDALPTGGRAWVKWVVALSQPALGALPFSQKKRIEEAIGDRRFFTAAGATGLNILHNMLIYPAVMVAFGALVLKRDVFTTQLTSLIVLGVAIAGLEAVLRMREAVLHAAPLEQVVYRAAAYSPPLVVLFAPLTRLMRTSEQVGVMQLGDFHGGEFEDKQERERRYGEVYTLREQGNGFFLRLEFPRRVPHSALKDELRIPDEMPDYDYDLALQNGFIVVKGHVEQPDLRKLAAVSPAFPPDFTTHIKLPAPVAGFKHRFVDKALEVVLVKQ
jgi:ferredoxin